KSYSPKRYSRLNSRVKFKSNRSRGKKYKIKHYSRKKRSKPRFNKRKSRSFSRGRSSRGSTRTSRRKRSRH
ncbi:MAG: hypothetical protein PF689_05810, partial [Deltaproteobacteria bacterium]|nr:hypothetical protein [Deltaproteobacteria bacterium]